MSKILSLEIEILPNQTMHITFLTLAFIILLFASFATDKFDYQPVLESPSSSCIWSYIMFSLPSMLFPQSLSICPNGPSAYSLNDTFLRPTVYGPWCSKAGMIWPSLYSYSALFTHLLWLLLHIICYCSSVYILSLLYYKVMKAAAESQSFFLSFTFPNTW